MSRGLSQIKLTCMHCSKTLKTFINDEFYAFLYSDDPVYVFCGKDCMDEWSCTVTPEKDFDAPQHPIICKG